MEGQSRRSDPVLHSPAVIRAVAAGALLLVLSACGYRVAGSSAPDDPYFEGVSSTRANTALRDAQGNIVGLATFRETRFGVLVDLRVTDLPPGTHGVHVHAAGRCETPSFTSAGAHFNPNAAQHGMKNERGPHAGDLPNLVVGQDRRGSLAYVNPYLSLQQGASHSLLIGTSLVVHAAADDEKTDPSGNSGDRIACGVIARAA